VVGEHGEKITASPAAVLEHGDDAFERGGARRTGRKLPE
jgi:hypothetical protein